MTAIVQKSWREQQNMDAPADVTKTRRARNSITLCPYCNSPALIRNNMAVDALHRDIYLICTNAECGHSWKAQLAFVYSISTPVNPIGGITLPVTQRRRRNHQHYATEPPEPALPEPVD